MSWMVRALETYERNSALAGKIREGMEPLLPVAHMTLKAQLEITIDQDGTFKGAQEVDKADCSTMIPVTEASGGRSSGIAPHPLNDTLSYIAGDFSSYSEKDCSKKFEAYCEGLQQWAESEFSHPKVRAVYQYISKGLVMRDLINCGRIALTTEGKLDKKKMQGAEYEKVLVRFRVLDAEHPDWTTATWEDETLLHIYGDYYSAVQSGESDICYLTGKRAVITSNHPKGTVASSYGAKLISANDTTNFTFKGRFANAAEACTVSYEASQKAHAALAWLSRNQGVFIGNKEKRTYIAWMPSGKKVEAFNDQLSLGFGKAEEEQDEPQTFPEFRQKLQKAFQGYAEYLTQDAEQEDVAIIGLDAATTGRLSVTYYQELAASDFLERMQYWQQSCSWYYKNGKTGKSEIRTPSIQQIVKHAFGTEQGNFVEADDKVLKQQAERLIACMTEALPIPRDIVHALYVKASSPQCYKNWWNREVVLSTACAVVAKGQYHDRGGKQMKGADFEMELEAYLKGDRSYLFGKLLATLERVEEEALYRKGEGRETNAIRLQAAFVSHPMTTWKVIEDALRPYYEQLSSYKKNKYKEEMADITDALLGLYAHDGEQLQAELNRVLTETYLLGYYQQRRKLRQYEDKKSQIVESDCE